MKEIGPPKYYHTLSRVLSSSFTLKDGEIRSKDLQIGKEAKYWLAWAGAQVVGVKQCALLTLIANGLVLFSAEAPSCTLLLLSSSKGSQMWGLEVTFSCNTWKEASPAQNVH